MNNEAFLQLDLYHRRERILDVAADLFAEKGYDSVTTLELASAVSCCESSLFSIFPTKDLIYQALFDEWESKVNVLPTIKIIDCSAIKTLRNFWNSYMTRSAVLHVNMRPRLEHAVFSRRENHYRKQIHEITRQLPDFSEAVLAPIFSYGQEIGEIRDGDPKELARFFYAVLWGEICARYDADYQLPYQSLLDVFIKR